jgi:hypothetical protein
MCNRCVKAGTAKPQGHVQSTKTDDLRSWRVFKDLSCLGLHVKLEGRVALSLSTVDECLTFESMCTSICWLSPMSISNLTSNGTHVIATNRYAPHCTTLCADLTDQQRLQLA